MMNSSLSNKQMSSESHDELACDFFIFEKRKIWHVKKIKRRER
jgi:hypothetical protein